MGLHLESHRFPPARLPLLLYPVLREALLHHLAAREVLIPPTPYTLHQLEGLRVDRPLLGLRRRRRRRRRRRIGGGRERGRFIYNPVC
jgi:hypothetical protein